MAIKPEKIAQAPGLLAIVWSDGKESYLDFEALRRACPCAVCQGEPDALGRVVRPETRYVANSFELEDFEMIGGYAIRFIWKDHHSSGFYTYDLLRSLGD